MFSVVETCSDVGQAACGDYCTPNTEPYGQGMYPLDETDYSPPVGYYEYEGTSKRQSAGWNLYWILQNQQACSGVASVGGYGSSPGLALSYYA